MSGIIRRNATIHTKTIQPESFSYNDPAIADYFYGCCSGPHSFRRINTTVPSHNAFYQCDSDGCLSIGNYEISSSDQALHAIGIHYSVIVVDGNTYIHDHDNSKTHRIRRTVKISSNSGDGIAIIPGKPYPVVIFLDGTIGVCTIHRGDDYIRAGELIGITTGTYGVYITVGIIGTVWFAEFAAIHKRVINSVILIQPDGQITIIGKGSSAVEYPDGWVSAI